MRAGGSLDQSQAEEHAARSWAKAGLEPHHEVQENVALVQLPSGKVSVYTLKKCHLYNYTPRGGVGCKRGINDYQRGSDRVRSYW